MFSFINIAYAAGSNPQAQSAQGAEQNPFAILFFIGAAFLIFYFLIIRPQKKQQKDHLETIKNLKKNDEVITSSGIHGTIVNIKDKTFILRIDDNAKIEIQKSFISLKKKKGSGLHI